MSDHTPDTPTKQCTKCGETFPATTEYWYKHKNGRYGLFAECKKCNIKRASKRREEKREYDKQYYKNKRDDIVIRRRRWREVNADKIRNQHSKWRENNKDKIRTNNRNFEARKRNAEGSHTAAQVSEQFKRQKGHCYYCGCKLDKNNYHADHVIPISRGGSNYISNIVCACPTCNISKKDKFPHEWKGTDRLL